MEVKEEIIITLPSEETYIPEKEPEPKVYIKKKPVYTFFKRKQVPQLLNFKHKKNLNKGFLNFLNGGSNGN